jgi:hypothetical protein
LGHFCFWSFLDLGILFLVFFFDIPDIQLGVVGLWDRGIVVEGLQ